MSKIGYVTCPRCGATMYNEDTTINDRRCYQCYHPFNIEHEMQVGEALLSKCTVREDGCVVIVSQDVIDSRKEILEEIKSNTGRYVYGEIPNTNISVSYDKETGELSYIMDGCAPWVPCDPKLDIVK